MCKLYVTNTYNPEIARNVAAQIVLSERDGSGILWSDNTGIRRDSAAQTVPWYLPSAMSEFLGVPTLPDDATVFAMHGRTATGARGPLNTHPLDAGNAVILHNGVIEGGDVLPGETDSWALAKAYAASTSAEGFAAFVAANITGYAAVIGYHKLRDEWIVARDGHARLYWSETPGGGLSFGTKPEFLTGGAQSLPDNVGIVLDASFRCLRHFAWELGSRPVSLRGGDWVRNWDLAFGTEVREPAFGTEGGTTRKKSKSKVKGSSSSTSSLFSEPLGRLAKFDAHVADQVARAQRDMYAGITESKRK